jgi:hypothetical protein
VRPKRVGDLGPSDESLHRKTRLPNRGGPLNSAGKRILVLEEYPHLLSYPWLLFSGGGVIKLARVSGTTRQR